MNILASVLAGVLFLNLPAANVTTNTAANLTTNKAASIAIDSATITKLREAFIENVDYHLFFTDEDVEVGACTMHNEAEITHSQMEQSAVLWCGINRMILGGYHSLTEVLRSPGQFVSHYTNYTSEEYALAVDVCKRATVEMLFKVPVNVGRTLPLEYCYFGGDGTHNHFRVEYENFSNYWDWSWGSPYAS